MQTRPRRRRAPIAGLARALRANIRRVPKLRVVVEDGRARILRPGARFAVTRTGEAYQGTWVPEGAPLPAGASDAFTEDEARIALALLREGTRTGRPPRGAETSDGRLIDAACEARGLTREELAAELGTGPAVLSRARSGKQALSAAHRARLLEWLGQKPKG